MIAQTQFEERCAVRLISAAYIEEPAMAPLFDTREEEAVLNELEGLTSARRGSLALPDGVTAEELLHESYGYGWTLVNAAFCHARPPGNRFNDEHRGAWYAAFGEGAAETAEAEVSYHIAVALKDAGAMEELVAYRQILSSFACPMHDLRREPDHPALDPEPASGYPVGQALARQVRAQGGNGILYPSVRRTGGECVAVLRPSVIQNVRQGDMVLMEWDGQAISRRVLAAA